MRKETSNDLKDNNNFTFDEAIDFRKEITKQNLYLNPKNPPKSQISDKIKSYETKEVRNVNINSNQKIISKSNNKKSLTLRNANTSAKNILNIEKNFYMKSPTKKIVMHESNQKIKTNMTINMKIAKNEKLDISEKTSKFILVIL